VLAKRKVGTERVTGVGSLTKKGTVWYLGDQRGRMLPSIPHGRGLTKALLLASANNLLSTSRRLFRYSIALSSPVMIVEIRAVNLDNVRSLLNALSRVCSSCLLQAASAGLRPSEHVQMF
jgi:hypothetical protein